MYQRLSLRLRVFLFFSFLALGSELILGMSLLIGYQKLGDPAALSAFLTAGIFGGFAILALITWIWFLFDEHVAKAIEGLASRMRTRTHAGSGPEIVHTHAKYLGDLAPAASAVTDTLDKTRNELAQAIQRETTRLVSEKARLEALLADVPVGVILASPEHRIVFYNGHAAELVKKDHAPGLDRSVFEYLREKPIIHAYERLLASAEPDAASDLLCAAIEDAHTFSARMRLMRSPAQGDGYPGYVLTLQDVTADLAIHTKREQLLEEIFDRVRRPAANLQTVIDMMGEEASGLKKDVIGGVRTLAHAITDLGARYDESRAEWWPMSETRARDLTDGLSARLEAEQVKAKIQAERLLLRCDAFEILALLEMLAKRLTKSGRKSGLEIKIKTDTPGAVIEFQWEGAPLPIPELENWLNDPLDVGLANMTGRSILRMHGTECWPEGHTTEQPGLIIPIRSARPAIAPAHPAPRSAVYDFDLLSKARTEGVAERKLSDLAFVVFDTETTGLLPSKGDEIVQIAAIRCLNGKCVTGETFESLVNPGRSIPAAASAIHHITDEMVADAESIDEIGRRFHKFAEGAVLVAHNAPFDLEFLHRHETEIGRRFDHPVLDTVLLSAVIFGSHETHTLDALAERLGIIIPEDARHTAMGDTIATADALLKLIPMLEARGLTTFGDVVAEVKKHKRLLKDLN